MESLPPVSSPIKYEVRVRSDGCAEIQFPELSAKGEYALETFVNFTESVYDDLISEIGKLKLQPTGGRYGYNDVTVDVLGGRCTVIKHFPEMEESSYTLGTDDLIRILEIWHRERTRPR